MAGVDFVLDRRLFGEHLFHLVWGEVLTELEIEVVVTLEDGPRLANGVLDAVVDGLELVQPRLLWEIPDLDAFRRHDGADVVAVFSGHDAEQGALAGSIVSQDADFGARKEGEPDVLEDGLLVVDPSQPLDGHDVLP